MALRKASRVRMSEGFRILHHQTHRALAGQIGHLLALPVRRRDRRRTGQLHAQGLGQGVHGGRRAHGVAIAGGRRRRGHQLHESGIVDLARRQHLASAPHDRARARTLALVPAVQHGTHGQGDGGNIDGGGRHQRRRRGLVAADGQHHPVDRIAEQHLHQPQIGQITIQRRRRPFAGFLDWVDGKFNSDAAGLADALAHALGQHQVMAVARGQVRAGLGDADDRLAGLQLLASQAIVQVPLQIQGGHPRIVGIVEPGARPQPPTRSRGFTTIGHDLRLGFAMLRANFAKRILA